MRVVLAGCENTPFFNLAAMAGIKNVLFSYYHFVKMSDDQKADLFGRMNKDKCEVICDSGLFTMMFGAGKGKNYDMEFMKNYAQTYIENARKFGLGNYSIVECDVHKILGMQAVFELRKYFEDSGLNVVYVWHREEGIDGLFQMAEKYKYIAISVPELRILFKQTSSRYQDGVKDLLKKLYETNKNLPKIHLLGNTVQETMETSIAYSCDSTSWLAGGRWGRGLFFDGRNLRNLSIRDAKFIGMKQQLLKIYPEIKEYIETKYEKEKTREYMYTHTVGAWSFKLYQDYLDKKFKWAGSDGNSN